MSKQTRTVIVKLTEDMYKQVKERAERLTEQEGSPFTVSDIVRFALRSFFSPGRDNLFKMLKDIQKTQKEIKEAVTSSHHEKTSQPGQTENKPADIDPVTLQELRVLAEREATAVSDLLHKAVMEYRDRNKNEVDQLLDTLSDEDEKQEPATTEQHENVKRGV